MIDAWLPFGAAFLFNLALIPLVRRVSFRVGRVSQPRADRWHRQPTPTLGGVGIYLAFILALAATLLLAGPAGFDSQINWGLMAASGLVFLIGLYDEFRPLSPAAKLIGQILAATLVIGLGYTSTFFNPRIANPVLAQLPNILFTYAWLVGITNAINLLDNMDGLAGGISLITAGFLGYFFWGAGNTSLLWISMALAGSVLGFLVYNFPPASIFMGDSGSLFLGFTLAVLAIAQQQQASDVLAVLTVPTLLFMLPILDTTLVTITRLLRGQSPAQGGRDHTSHRLIAFGLSERQTLFVLYSVAIVSGVMAAALEAINYWLSLLLAPALIVLLALLTAYLGGARVVTQPVDSPSGRAIARIMLELTHRRRLLEAALDFFLVGISYYLAFLFAYDLSMNSERLALFLRSFPLALAVTYLALYLAGVYRGVWRYVDLGDWLRYLAAALGSALLLAVVMNLPGAARLAGLSGEVEPLVYALYGIFLFLSLTASRSSFRLLDRLARRRPGAQGASVLILGAGDAGELALRWLLANPGLGYAAVGFLDDDPFRIGRSIHGVEVLGRLAMLDELLNARRAQGVILAGIEPASPAGQAAAAVCAAHGCWLRSLRLEFELIEKP